MDRIPPVRNETRAVCLPAERRALALVPESHPARCRPPTSLPPSLPMQRPVVQRLHRRTPQQPVQSLEPLQPVSTEH